MINKNFFKDIPGGLIAVATFVITAFGMLIINLHLNRYYYISDYSIISARAIHTGLVFMLVCGISAASVFAFYEIHDFTSITIKQTLVNFISKPIHLANVFIMLFGFTSNTPQESVMYSFFGYFSMRSYWLYPILMSSVFGFVIKFNSYPLIKISGDKFGKLFDKLSNGLLYIGLLSLPIMIYNSEEYERVLYFFGTISFWCMAYVAAVQDSQRRKVAGEKDINLSVYTKDTNMKSSSLLENFFMLCWIMVMIISLVSKYSNSLYPLIDFQYGGGKPINIMIVMDDDKIIEGKMLNYDDKRYYLISQDGQKIILIILK